MRRGTFPRRTVFAGLLAAVAVVYLCLVGMVETFTTVRLVEGWVTLVGHDLASDEIEHGSHERNLREELAGGGQRQTEIPRRPDCSGQTSSAIHTATRLC